MEKFVVFENMDDLDKEKIGFLIKPEKQNFGKVIIHEGDPINHMFLVERGQFELNKKIYFKNKETKFQQEIDTEKILYTKYFAEKGASSILSSKFKNILLDKPINYEKFKALVKGYTKISNRMICFGQYEIFGLVE